MFHTFLPMIPLTLTGALFFRKRIFAYGLPVLLTLVKVALTQPSYIWFFTCAGLLAGAFLVRFAAARWGTSLISLAVYALASVAVYELTANFGVWAIGSCTAGHDPLYASTLDGLFQCYRAAVPYAAAHFVRDVPLTLASVKGLELLGKFRIAKPTLRYDAPR